MYFFKFLRLTKNNNTDIITTSKMKFSNTNITKQNSAIALTSDSAVNLFNLPINIILLGINLILGLIIIIG